MKIIKKSKQNTSEIYLSEECRVLSFQITRVIGRQFVFGITPFLFLLFSFKSAYAQEKGQMVRLAKLQIDSVHLESYKSALKEEIETSVRLEPGVLTLYAVSEKENPTHITILEIYYDKTAYQTHIKTSHFLKYKNLTKDMIKSLQLVETDPLIPAMKIK
jgi:4-carboxymuconolactone decarboxylase